MNNAPIVTMQDAINLNTLIQQKIDSKLFVCCNYEPIERLAISEEQQFELNVTNLYNFAVDSSWFFTYAGQDELKVGSDNTMSRYIQAMSHVLTLIRLLRSISGHNQSAQNGLIASDRKQQYKSWLISHLKKDQLSSSKDYAKLNAVLAAEAKQLMQNAENYLRLICHQCAQKTVTDKMISQILKWYTSNTKTEYYLGFLETEYLARAQQTHLNGLEFKAKKWICEFMKSQYSLVLQQLTLLPGTDEQTVRKTINSKLDQIKKKINVYSTLSAAECKTEQHLHEYYLAICEQTVHANKRSDYVDGYWKCLTAQLRVTMDMLEHNSKNYTLLPQDIFGEDIQIFFSQLPSPTGDF